MFGSKQIYLYFSFTVPAVSAILVFIFNNIEKPYSMNIFCAIFVLLICAVTRVKKLITTTVYISTYMEVFLEPKINGRKWETRCNYQVNGYNSKELDNRNPLINNMFFRTISAWFLLGFFTYALYIMVLLKNDKINNLCDSIESHPVNFVFNTIFFLIIMYVSLSNRNIDRNMYIEHWENIKEKEEAEQRYQSPVDLSKRRKRLDKPGGAVKRERQR